MIACTACGHEIVPGAQFCPGCGEYLGWEGSTRTVDTPSGQPGSPDQPARPPDDPRPEQDPAPVDPEPAAPRLARVVSGLDAARQLAERHGRPDLGQHLAVVRQRLADRMLGVAVVGEFKRGKSTLVNAALQTDVCPVDADIVTAVPTIVRYGPTASAVAHLEPEEPGGEPTELPADVDRLLELVSERVDPALRRRLGSVEVRLPHRLLRTGLSLIDTPGVGGLDSAHGIVTLGALRNACAMIFVTDASQELTAPEVGFLRQALERCPAAICVVTKTDLYPQWRRIVELDRGHLAAAGIDVPLVAVSSFLRLRAWRVPELNAESGFAALFDWLRTDVLEVAAGEAVEAAARDIEFAQQQLRLEVVAEQEVLDRPGASAEVAGALRRRSERTGRLVDGHGGWQQYLGDGIDQLIADVRFDLAERVRVLVREVEAVIDQGDPKDTWSDVELWLQRQLMLAATANYEMLNQRAEDLAAEVAGEFALESEEPLALGLTAPAEVLRGLNLDDPSTEATSGQRATRMIFAGRTAILVPSLVFGVLAPHLLLLAAIGPLAVVVGTWIGRKLVRDERERQLVLRRQQARAACHRYLNEAKGVVGKDCDDALRRTRRELRDEFQARAAMLHTSSQRALGSVERAARLQPHERTARAAELAERQGAIEQLGADAGVADARGAA